MVGVTERKKVALFVHCFFPEHIYGTEMYTLQLAKHIREWGYDPVIVAALFPGGPLRETGVSYYEYDGLSVYLVDKGHYPPVRLRDTYYQETLASVYEKLIKAIQPDFAHVVHLSNHTGILAEVLYRLKIPSVATLTDFYGFCLKSTLRRFDGGFCRGPDVISLNCRLCYAFAQQEKDLKKRVADGEGTFWEEWMEKQPLIRWQWAFRDNTGIATQEEAADIKERAGRLQQCYRLFRAAIVPTEFTRNMYQRNGLKIPMYSIPFGVDKVFRQRSKPKRTGQSIRFGYVGQLDHHKGIDLLMDAFAPISSRAELWIYGQEKNNPAYFQLLLEKAVGHASIRFPGLFSPEDQPRVLDELDFIVIPSRWYENCPLILLAALASHTPVIIARVPGLTQFVEEGKSGYSFPVGDGEVLGRILEMLADNPEKARELQDNTNFGQDWAEMTEKTVEVYRRHFSCI